MTTWEARLDLGDEPALTLTADARSLRVREGTGTLAPLGVADIANIDVTIEVDVLKRERIVFQSTFVTRTGSSGSSWRATSISPGRHARSLLP